MGHYSAFTKEENPDPGNAVLSAMKQLRVADCLDLENRREAEGCEQAWIFSLAK